MTLPASVETLSSDEDDEVMAFRACFGTDFSLSAMFVVDMANRPHLEGPVACVTTTVGDVI